jgi:signal transduction histidine kinase
MPRIKWPVALATAFVLLLGWYVVYTQQIVRALRANAETLTEIYGEVQGGLNSIGPTAEVDALSRLQEIIIASRVPIVMTGPGDTVIAVRNLPFDADLETAQGQAAVLEYASRLDVRHPPVGGPEGGQLHYGDTPEVLRLRYIPWLQVAGLLLTVVVGFTMIRFQRRVEGERAWTAMARELAHQLGTPISSLQGWLELLRLPKEELPEQLLEGEVAAGIEEDLLRLERISHRFELIGRDTDLNTISLKSVVEDLERYLQARLPRFGPGVRLRVEIPHDLPPVKGNEVLLTWALENVVKNALDALAGRGGRITIRARSLGESESVELAIVDDGPGVQLDVRDRIFEPGITTKSGGWGVGLALSRRIVEGVHRGRIEVLDTPGGGATFQLRLPAADSD